MSVITKIYELESFLKQEKTGIPEIVAEISALVEVNAYFIDPQGEILTAVLPNGSDCPKITQGTQLSLKQEFKQRVGFIFQTAANIPVETCFFKDDTCFHADSYMTIVPVRTRASSAHLLLTKPKQQFTEEQLILAEVASLVISLYFCENKSNHSNQLNMDLQLTARMVLDSLSFSELKAISNVLMDLNGFEGFLVASKIADRIGISRSVIVNAMRKLESAGVVESRSLGIKGTYIKVKNKQFYELLKERIK